MYIYKIIKDKNKLINKPPTQSLSTQIVKRDSSKHYICRKLNL